MLYIALIVCLLYFTLAFIRAEQSRPYRGPSIVESFENESDSGKNLCQQHLVPYNLHEW